MLNNRFSHLKPKLAYVYYHYDSLFRMIFQEIHIF